MRTLLENSAKELESREREIEDAEAEIVRNKQETAKITESFAELEARATKVLAEIETVKARKAELNA